VTARAAGPVLRRRALRVTQASDTPLYLLSLTAREISQLADISRVSRDDAGDLIGYQRPEVRQHVQDITDYLDGDQVLFPNPIIIALPTTVRFACSRGRGNDDRCAVAGTLKIPFPDGDGKKPGWIVDGQQRALALARSRRQDFAVPVNAFITDSVELQRDQFLRINNTRPLPRGLVTELLPEISTPLPARLSLRQAPAALCDLLNRDPTSPFCGLIRRPSRSTEVRGKAVITDTIIVQMLEESLTTPSGCLFPFRNPSTGETDFTGLWQVLLLYWTAVRDTFPDAWGKPPAQSRLMHGTGIRAMGRLMDRLMAAVDPGHDEAATQIRAELALLAPSCRWTSGRWEELDLRWNQVENLPRHRTELSSFLIRTHMQAKAARR
jgi:DGQHR domain-containing protein